MKNEEEAERLSKELESIKSENKKLRSKNERLEDRLDRLESKVEAESSIENSDDEISRRGFLKKIGFGAIGLSAMTITPASSKLKISKDGFSSSQGIVNLDESDLNIVPDNSIKSVDSDGRGYRERFDFKAGLSDGSSYDLFGGGQFIGCGFFVIVDDTNNATALIANTGGSLVEVSDPENHFGTSSGSGNSIDVYTNGGDPIKVENNTGSDLIVGAKILGFS